MSSVRSLEQSEIVINTFLRIAPSSEGRLKGSYLAVSEQGDSITITNPAHRTAETKESFTFERVFYPDTSQAEVYGEIKTKVIDNLFAGKNVGIFSFGQSGSGKSYTIFGDKNLSSEINAANIESKDDKRGIMLRACKNILNKIEEMPEHNIELTVQFYQVRQVTIHNLLNYSPSMNLKNGWFVYSLK